MNNEQDEPTKVSLSGIGTTIRLERERLKLSRRAVAIASGVTETTISNVEFGKSASMDTIVRILSALGKQLYIEDEAT